MILEKLTDSCAVLVVIGKDWESARFEKGKLKHKLRLDDPEDWVRLEIKNALAGRKTLIPVLLNGVERPDREWLANFELQELSDAQSVELRVGRSKDFQSGFDDLVALLRKKCPTLPQVDVPAETEPATTPTEISPSYIEWLKEQCADITPFAMEPAQGLSVCLQDVYIPPLTSRRFDRMMDGLLSDSKTGKRGKRKPKQPVEPKEDGDEAKPQLLLSVLGESSLYVSGDPGTGKTTFCRWVGWLAAAGKEPQFRVDDPEYHETLPGTLCGKLPVLVRLREIGEFLVDKSVASKPLPLQAALKEWVTETKPGQLSWNDVKSHLDHGSLLLILDGVDEVPLSSGDPASGLSPRELFLTALSSAAPEWLKLGNRILITSRPYGLEPDQVRQIEKAGLPEARLEPLPVVLQDLLATRWFVALEKTLDEGRDVSTAMLKQARGLSEDVARMTANPLLLTAICVIYSSGKELPQDRHHLYDRIVDTALYSRFPRDKNLITKVRGRLAAIALGMHTGQPIEPGRMSPAREVHHVELDAILSDYIKANPETESEVMLVDGAREELLNRSGLLLSSRSKHAAFSHWSFQEFLAAERMTTICHANEDQLFKQICEWSSLIGWRPTLSFLFDRRVAQLGWQSGTPLIKRAVAEIEKRSLAKSVGLACCAADAVGLLLDLKLNLQEELLAPFRTVCLAAIDQEVELKPRIDLARALGRIGDPRVANDLRDAEDPNTWVTVQPGKYPLGDAEIQKEFEEQFGESNFAMTPSIVTIAEPLRISRYPVTNGQIAVFLNQKGYETKSYWDDEGWEWRQKNKVFEPEYWQNPTWNGPTQPVVGVSWYEANAFCRWANCRLPTEQEWEAAARGPKGTVYPWGNESKVGICNSAEADIGVTTPVGSFPSTVASCGTQDMAGNVWEWCADWRDATKKIFRAVRRGSCKFLLSYARSAFRFGGTPSERNSEFGFRVVSLRQDS